MSSSNHHRQGGAGSRCTNATRCRFRECVEGFLKQAGFRGFAAGEVGEGAEFAFEIGGGDFVLEAVVEGEQLDDLTKRVAATGFNLLPTPLGARWGHCWNGFSIHFFGMLITASLLSLGAPFWYNSLKDLMSLRPAVSKLIGAEKAAQAEEKK